LDEGGGDGVAFLQRGERGGVDFEEHGHGAHVTGDGFVFDEERGVVGADGDDHAAERMSSEGGVGFLGVGGGGGLVGFGGFFDEAAADGFADAAGAAAVFVVGVSGGSEGGERKEEESEEGEEFGFHDGSEGEVG